MNKRPLGRLSASVVVSAAIAWAVPAAADTGTDAKRPDPLQVGPALHDTALDTIRGGFETDAGLRISFGIERAVYVNGNLVTTTRLNLAALAVASGGVIAPQIGVDAAAALIRNGPNTTVATTNFTSIVQNALDGQAIQAITTINATVNSLGVLTRGVDQSAIQQALNGSMRR